MKFLSTLCSLLLLVCGMTAQTITEVVQNSPDHNTLETALTVAGLDDDLASAGPFTLFAPTDEAFEVLGSAVDDLLMDTAALADALLYHVLDGAVASADVTNGLIATPLNNANTLKFTVTSADGEVFVNQALVTVRDIPASNGVVHVIDAVVFATETVADIAIDNGFNTLTTAVVAAELLPALTDPLASYTVFAPADSAFEALGGTLDQLLMDPTGDLRDILLYHVLGSEVPSSALDEFQAVEPLNTANTLKIYLLNGGPNNISVNHATVTAADVPAGNGIVHVLNRVVLPTETVVDVALDNGLNVLREALIKTALVPALSNPGNNITLLAPSDAGFNLRGIREDNITNFNLNQLQDILAHHIVLGQLPADSIANGTFVGTAFSSVPVKFTVTSADNTVFANQAEVSAVDLTSGNGLVHVIEDILFPVQTAIDVALAGGYNTFTAAAVLAELMPALTNPFDTLTVFAPSEDAFAAVDPADLAALVADPTGALRDVLLYHTIRSQQVQAADITNGLIVTPLNDANTLKFTVTSADGDVFVNQAQVSQADIASANGVVHGINQVVLPIETPVDVAIDNNFSTLSTAVVAAELMPALTDPAGTYTVFAPTDAAFAELGMAVDDLLDDPTGELRNILLYHVLGTEVFSTDLMDGTSATTLEGNLINITVNMDGVFINESSEVVMADIDVDNGVVHIIDEVLDRTTSTSNVPANRAGISMFPNPAVDLLNITFDEQMVGEKVVRFFNAQGQEVHQEFIAGLQASIPLGDMSAGIYMLNIQDQEGKRYFQKISIAR